MPHAQATPPVLLSEAHWAPEGGGTWTPCPMNGMPIASIPGMEPGMPKLMLPMPTGPIVPFGSIAGQALLGRHELHPAMPAAAAAIVFVGSKPAVGVVGSWLRGSPARGPRAIPTPPSGFKYFPDLSCEAYVSAFFQAAANLSDFCCSLASIGAGSVGTPAAAFGDSAVAALGGAGNAGLQGTPATSRPPRGAGPRQFCTMTAGCRTVAVADEEELGGEEDELATAAVAARQGSPSAPSCIWPAKNFARSAAMEDCMFLRRFSTSSSLPMPASKLPPALHAA